MTRVAAIDCGTNSIRLLIAESTPDGRLVDIDRRLELTRLGQGVDAAGEFHPKALARTLDAASDFAARIAKAQVDRVRLVATSAARDAGNREEFFSGVRERLGVEAEIISGDEEAYLSFRGALTALPDAPAPALVMDIGGGSTELVVGETSPQGPVIDHGLSLDVGSVRVRERFLAGDPPTAKQIAEAAAFIDGLLDSSGVAFGDVRSWIGVGGTVTSLSALHQRLPVYDRTLVHGSSMTQDEVEGIANELLGLTVAQVRRFPSMPRKRADVICAGALVAARVGRRSPVPLLVSEYDILDGIALGLLDG